MNSKNGEYRDGGCSASPRALLQSAHLSIARQIFSLFSPKSLFGIHHLSGLLPRIASRTSHLACLDNVDIGTSSACPCDRRLPRRYIETSDTHDNILLLPDSRSRMSLVFLRLWGRIRSIGGHTGLRHISGSILSFQAHRDRVRISPSQLQRDQIEDGSSLTVIGRHRHCITLAKLLPILPFSPVSRYDYSQVTSVYSDLFVC